MNSDPLQCDGFDDYLGSLSLNRPYSMAASKSHVQLLHHGQH